MILVLRGAMLVLRGEKVPHLQGGVWRRRVYSTQEAGGGGGGGG
jgi:hypothetical protein